MSKTAWVFPGQGSQVVGMGLDLLDVPAGKTKFAQAAEILGWSVPEICQSQEDKLSRTLYTQPCLYVVSAILADLMQERGHQPWLQVTVWANTWPYILQVCLALRMGYVWSSDELN